MLLAACAGCGNDGDETPSLEPGGVPVVLVHGYGGNPESLRVLGRRLRSRGRPVLYAELPDRGTADIRRSGKAVADAVRDAKAEAVELVGFSLGGLAVRSYLRFERGAARARRVVLVGTPNHGTALAASAPSRRCQYGCADMAPGSSFLRALNAGDDTPGRARYVSLYSRFDEIVVPPRTSRLKGARNIALGAPAISHVGLVTDPRALRLIVAALD